MFSEFVEKPDSPSSLFVLLIPLLAAVSCIDCDFHVRKLGGIAGRYGILVSSQGNQGEVSSFPTAAADLIP